MDFKKHSFIKIFFSSGPRMREDKGPDQLGKEHFDSAVINI